MQAHVIHMHSFTLAHMLTYFHMLICSQTCTHSFTDMTTHSNAQATIYTCFYTHMCAVHMHTQALTHTNCSQTQTYYFGSNQLCKTHITPSVFPATPPMLLLQVTLSEAWNHISMWLRQDLPCFLWLAHHSSDDAEH